MNAAPNTMENDGHGRPLDPSPELELSCISCGSRHGVVKEDWMAGFALCTGCLALARIAEEQEPEEEDLGDGD